MNTNMNAQRTTGNKTITWFKRLGIVGFLFFLIKGLLWLLIPYLLAKGLF
jgi:hypothetical protein